MSSTRAGSRAGRETGDSARRYVSRDGDYLLEPVDGDRGLRQLAWGTAPGGYRGLFELRKLADGQPGDGALYLVQRYASGPASAAVLAQDTAGGGRGTGR